MFLLKIKFHFLAILLVASLFTSTSSYADPTTSSDNEEISTPDAIPTSTNNDTPTLISADFQNDGEDDLWVRIRQGYGIPDLDNSLVLNQLNWYSTRTSYILRATERASLYLYHVVEELEKRGMPTELALLPFIESAFNPQAISSAKASGMWQFIPSTGRDFNLKQNMFQDERRGVLDSTDAALTYLEKLYDMFGDWQLALAAYNWGEGSVQRAIKKQQIAGLPIDFNSMSYLMPKETQNYVPKLQAVKNIISNPALFNILLPKVENQPYFVVIDKTRDIDVQVAAQLAELTIDEFKELNPQFNWPIITGSTDTKILLPTDNAEIYKNNLSKWAGPLSSWTAYTVRKNERVENLAQRVGAQASVIRNVNHIPVNMMVKAGSTILIPKTAQTEDNDISQLVVDNASLRLAYYNTKKINITATKKDSLTTLAKRYKVSITQIKKWNHLKTNALKSGQRLHIEVAVSSFKRHTHTTKMVSSKKSVTFNKRTKKTAIAAFRQRKSSY